MGKQLGALIFGLIVFVVGGALSTTVGDSFATAGADAQMGSFSNARSLNDLMPLIWYVGLMILGLGSMGLGILGFSGKGPLKN